MSEISSKLGGYVCAPYLHDHDSIELKDYWATSRNIESSILKRNDGVSFVCDRISLMIFSESLNLANM